MTNPKISVVMPVYNGEKYLKEAIDSILNQTYTDFEFIIVNDGSTDNTEKIILSYEDKRIVYIKNEENLKIAKTLNKGIEFAKGKYIARMDADDISMPERFEVQIEFMESNQDIGVVGCMWYCIDGQSKTFDTVEHLPISKVECAYLGFVGGENPVGHPCTMFRKELIDKVGNYDHDYVTAEDVELWFRMMESGVQFYNLPEKLICYRYHDEQISSNNQKQIYNHHKALAVFLSNQLNRDISPQKASLLRNVNFSDENIFKTTLDIKDMLTLKKDCMDLYFKNYACSSKIKNNLILKEYESLVLLQRFGKLSKLLILWNLWFIKLRYCFFQRE